MSFRTITVASVWGLVLTASVLACWKNIPLTACQKVSLPWTSPSCGYTYTVNPNCPSIQPAGPGGSGMDTANPPTTLTCVLWTRKLQSGVCVDDDSYTFSVNCRTATGNTCTVPPLPPGGGGGGGGGGGN